MFREPEFFIPALITPVFFFVVQVGALQDFAEGSGTVVDFKAFQLPVAIIFAVTGVSRASAIVTDIQSGYFDRLLLTPIRRQMLLLGLMVADFVGGDPADDPRAASSGSSLGVRFETGILGHARLPALRRAVGRWRSPGSPTRSPSRRATPPPSTPASSCSSRSRSSPRRSCPKEALTGWLATVATYNPVTYVLDGLRSVVSTGWETDRLMQGFAASIGLMVISFGLASVALAGRIKRG